MFIDKYFAFNVQEFTTEERVHVLPWDWGASFMPRALSKWPVSMQIFTS